MRDLGPWTPRMLELFNQADEQTILRFQRSLTALRKTAGWTVEELAEEAGMSPLTLFLMESNFEHRLTAHEYVTVYTLLERRAEECELLRQVMPILLKPEESENKFKSRDPVWPVGFDPFDTDIFHHTAPDDDDDENRTIIDDPDEDDESTIIPDTPPVSDFDSDFLDSSRTSEPPGVTADPLADRWPGIEHEFFGDDHPSQPIGWNSLFSDNQTSCPSTFQCFTCGCRLDMNLGSDVVCPDCGRKYNLRLKTDNIPIFECFYCGHRMDWYTDIAICLSCGNIDAIY